MLDNVKLLSLFSGIGAFEKAMQNISLSYDLVNYCEIDRYASKSYSLLHREPEGKNLLDITKVNEKSLPKDIGLLTYGFPCQDISAVGKQQGFFKKDGTKTRSGLFFDALRIIKYTKPRVAIAENVKALTGKKFEKEFAIVLQALEESGYNNYYKVLNAKDYDLPQKRQRVFIVSIRKDIDDHAFTFPEKKPLVHTLKEYLQDNVDEKYYLTNLKEYFVGHSLKMEERGNGFRFRLHQKAYAEIAQTITTHNGARVDDNFILENDLLPNVPCITINKNCPIPIDKESLKTYRIRRLTPIECFTLTGFDEEDCALLMKNGMSDTRLYHQAGNSIAVPVLEELLKAIRPYLK